MSEISLPCLGAAHVHAGEIVVPQVPAGGPRQAHVIPTHMLHKIRIEIKIIKDKIISLYSLKKPVQSYLEFPTHLLRALKGRKHEI
jgi:hypothetical protein